MLSEYQLNNCSSMKFTVEVSDHAGNLQSKSKVFHIDHIRPSVSFEADTNCSWQSEGFTDMQSYCPITIEINDDKSLFLVSSYQISIRVLNSDEFEYLTISNSKTIDLGRYVGETVLISVTGSDRAGNSIITNLFRVQIGDDIEPRWQGITCVGENGCTWNGTVIASFVEDSIGADTYSGQAPIASASFVFTTAIKTYNFTTSTFSSSSIPDGTYSLSIELIDEAGRVFTPRHITFVYDNTAPIIEILETQSNGYRDSDLMISCDECKLVWRVHDETYSPSTTNHGNFPLISGQYQMSTAYLGHNIIVISAEDAHGRVTSLTINTTSVQSTEIDPVDGIVSESGIKILCMENLPEQGLRQVTCLWSRIETNVEYVPIKIQVSVDQLQLRNATLRIETDGGAKKEQRILISDGIISLAGIKYHMTEFDVILEDEYSEISGIHYKLIEHVQPWSETTLMTPSLSEMDDNSTFNILLTAPPEEQKFHLLTRYPIQDLFSCKSEYQFFLDGKLESLIEDNCQIISSQIHPSQDVEMTVSIEHISLSTHNKYHLFNLVNYSVILNYEDSLGISASSKYSGSLIINADKITRAPDSPPLLESNGTNCPFGKDTTELHSDGFLQSDYSVNLNACGDLISDPDGIVDITWVFEFKNSKARSYEVKIICKGTFFPENWDIQSAIDNNEQCSKPTNDLPEGSGYSVTITAYVKDSSLFRINEFGEGQRLKLLTLECESNNDNCTEIEFTIKDVTVSSDLSPLTYISNSRDLESWSKDFSSTTTYWITFGMILIILFGIITLMLNRRKNKSQKLQFQYWLNLMKHLIIRVQQLLQSSKESKK
jgi:hypothetical protein